MGKTQNTGRLTNGIFQDSSNNIAIGDSTASGYKFKVTGTSNLNGALSGTSATFSGTITSGTGSGNTLSSGSIDVGKDIGLAATQGIVVNNARVLAFASTGAATFSSSVTATSFVKGQYLAVTSGTTAGYLIKSGDWQGDASTDLSIAAESANLRFYTNGSAAEKMRITSSGNVGIGTSSPSSILTVLKTVTTNFGAKGNAALSLGTAGSAGEANLINFGYDTESWQPAYMGYLCTSGAGSSNGALVFATRDSTSNVQPTERMRITSGGNVLIGTTDTSFPFKVAKTASGWQGQFANGTSAVYLSHGEGYGAYIDSGTLGSSSSRYILTCASGGSDRFIVRGDGYIFSIPTYNNTFASAANMYVNTDGSFGRATSSLKYKENVIDYTKGLAEIMQLRPVSYTSKNPNEEGQTFAGLIAEEVHDLGLTEFVQYAEDGTPDALAYQNMVALAFKAIQEQQAQIEELKALIAAK